MSDNTDFVLSVIGGLSGTFGGAWSSVTSQVVVDDALESYGVSTEAEMTDTAKKKTLLRYFAWSKVRDELLLDPTSYRSDGESFDFKLERLDKRVQEAYVKASPYLPDGQIESGQLTFVDDPYSINGQVEHDT
jgi:hypothetical protein